MKKCKVLIPFTDKVTDELRKVNEEVLLSDERVADIRKVNVNMVLVIAEEPEEELPSTPDVEKKEPEEPVKTKRRSTKKKSE